MSVQGSSRFPIPEGGLTKAIDSSDEKVPGRCFGVFGASLGTSMQGLRFLLGYIVKEPRGEGRAC